MVKKIRTLLPPPIQKPLAQIAKLLITGLVLYYVVNKLGWTNIITTFENVRWQYVLYGLILCVASIFLGALQWHVLLNHKSLKVPFRETLELYFIGMFFSNIGTLAGDTVKVAYIKARHSFGKLGFAATFLDRFAGLVALSFFAGLACLYLLQKNELHSKNELLIAKFVVVLLVVMLIMLLFLLVRRVRKVVLHLIDNLPIPKKQFFKDIIAATGLSVHQLPIVVSVGILSLFIQALRISVHICSAAALGILTIHNVVYFFVFVPLIAIFMIIPLPFGIRETVGGSLFSLTGIPQNAAFIMQFMATFLGVLGSLWGGIEFLLNRTRIKPSNKTE
jgi:uncharacterized protein (TIRG00374 family)